MRLFFHKISLIVSSILSVLLLSCSATPVTDNISNDVIKDNNIIEEKTMIESETKETDQKELQIEEKKNTEVVEDKKTNSDSSESTSTTSNTSNNNTKQETINNNQNDINSSISTSPSVEVHEEAPKQETNNNVNQYIGVASPNDFYYSFHHGKIEYSNMDSCLADVPKISFKDTTDIINAWCIDVVDGQGTILGQYLYINCSSGNCDKYKSHDLCKLRITNWLVL